MIRQVLLTWTSPLSSPSLLMLRRGTFALCILILSLIALGGATRAMDAGLACPDWPLCFGQFIPDFDVRVYFEFIHRVLAGFIALMTLALSIAIHANPAIPSHIRNLSKFTLVILGVQIIMGGLTVLKLLHFGTVTAHLGLGIAFFGCLVWIYLSIQHEESNGSKRPDLNIKGLGRANLLYLLVSSIIYIQILLGGLVSSNYAGLACPDWPTCQGRWLPMFGGLVGLQITHRIGAYISIFAIFGAYYLLSKTNVPKSLLVTGRWMNGLILAQLLVGIFNVKLGIPPLVTVAHLVFAALIFAFGLRIVFESQRLSKLL